MALTSLFKKSFANVHNKFTIVLPTGGIIYFFMEEMYDFPKVFISTQNNEFTGLLERDDIRFK